MQDSPTGEAILRELQAELKAGIAPGFQQAVAANAVALALREKELAAASHEAERARLAVVLGGSGALADLNEALAAGIRDGTVDTERRDVIDHMIRTTIEKMQIDQPAYPAFRIWRATLENLRSDRR